jgi:hypothetical protein
MCSDHWSLMHVMYSDAPQAVESYHSRGNNFLHAFNVNEVTALDVYTEANHNMNVEIRGRLDPRDPRYQTWMGNPYWWNSCLADVIGNVSFCFVRFGSLTLSLAWL